MVETAVVVSIIGLGISFCTFVVGVAVKSVSERQNTLCKNVMNMEKEWAESGRDSTDFLMYFMEKYGPSGFVKIFAQPTSEVELADARRAQTARAHLFGFWSRFAILHAKGYLPRDALKRIHATFHWYHRVQQYIFVGLPFDRAVKPFQGHVGEVYDEWCDHSGNGAGDLRRLDSMVLPHHYAQLIKSTVGDRFKDPWNQEMWYFAHEGPLFVAEDVMAAAKRELKDKFLPEADEEDKDPHPCCLAV